MCDQDKHLDRILTILNWLIATAKNRTPGMWSQATSFGCGIVANARSITHASTRKEPDAAFIAACAGAAEAGWKSSLMIIKGLLEVKYGWQDNEHSREVRSKTIIVVITAWPEELLAYYEELMQKQTK